MSTQRRPGNRAWLKLRSASREAMLSRQGRRPNRRATTLRRPYDNSQLRPWLSVIGFPAQESSAASRRLRDYDPRLKF